jgi:hypothetical protein
MLAETFEYSERLEEHYEALGLDHTVGKDWITRKGEKHLSRRLERQRRP